MIPLFKDNGDRIALAYSSLITLNSPNDPQDDIYECNIYSSSPQWDALTEPKTQGHGLEGHEPRKVVTLHRIDGVIRAPTLAKLYDKVLALNEAFDMVNAFDSDSSTEHNRGYLPFWFSIPTTNTALYPTGLIPAEIRVRSLAVPVSRSSQFEGTTCRFTLMLQAADPRIYYTTEQTVSRANAGTMNADNDDAGFPSPVTLTIDFSGAGSGRTSFLMGGRTLVLDLSGLISTDEVVVDMERQTIELNGGSAMNLYDSGEFWQDLPKGATTTITIANITGTLAASVEASWYRAL